MPFHLEESAPLVLDESHVAAGVEAVEGSTTGGEAALECLGGFSGDHVDDAPNGIGTIEGRRGAFDDLNAVETADRLAVHIEDAALDALGPHDGKTIDQNQGLAGIDSLNLGFGPVSRGAATRDDARLFGQNIPNRLITGIVQHGAGDDVDLGGRVFAEFLLP